MQAFCAQGLLLCGSLGQAGQPGVAQLPVAVREAAFTEAADLYAAMLPDAEVGRLARAPAGGLCAVHRQLCRRQSGRGCPCEEAQLEPPRA